MQKSTPILTNFTAGEIDPRFHGRVDLSQYFNACRTLENAIVLTLGGAEKRPGTYYVATAKDSSKKIRLVPFKFSTTQEYILEFGEHYVRFYAGPPMADAPGQIVVAYTAWVTSHSYVIGNLVTESGNHYRCLVAHSSGTFETDLTAGKWEVAAGETDLAYEIPTTYDEDELFDLKFTQSADVLYVAHPAHAPAKITRTAHTAWTITDISFTANPFTGAGDYPSCVAFFEERLCWAATDDEPTAVWLSKSGDYENMTTGTEDDAAMKYTINADGVNRIRWMVPQNYLFLGAVDAEWRFGGAQPTDPITPTSVNAKRQTANGSNNVQAILASDTIIYAQYHGRKVFDFGYSLEKDSYVSGPLTKLCRHITKSGIVGMAYQQEPDPLIWYVRDDGVLLTMTFYAAEKVIAWSRHITEGNFESVAVIHGPDEDEVWVSVERTINDSTVRYIEFFKPREFGVKEDAFFVDAGLTFDGGAAQVITDATQADPVVVTYEGADPTNGWKVYIEAIVGMDELNGNTYIVANVNAGANTFELSGVDGAEYTEYESGGTFRRVVNEVSGLDHLEDETVDVCVDGAAHDECKVASGAITLNGYYNKIHAGLHYAYKLQPMKLEVQAMTGSAQAKNKRIEAITVRFYNTIGCKAGETEDDVKDLIFGENAELFSGDKALEFEGDYGTAAELFFLHDQPLPCTILAIMPELAIHDRN